MRYWIIFLFILPTYSFAQRDSTDYIKAIRHSIKVALKDKSFKHIITNKPISDKQTAIEVAEPILFKTYGKDRIRDEQPYNADFIDGYWVLSGTLPYYYTKGGTFLIILDGKDGNVIKLTHSK